MTDKPFFCNTSKHSSIPALETIDAQTQQHMVSQYNRSIQGSNRKEVQSELRDERAFPSLDDINVAVNNQSKLYEPYNKVQLFQMGRAQKGHRVQKSTLMDERHYRNKQLLDTVGNKLNTLKPFSNLDTNKISQHTMSSFHTGNFRQNSSDGFTNLTSRMTRKRVSQPEKEIQ